MPEEQNEDRNSLLNRAAFGKQVEEFWKSDIGAYMLRRINSEITEAFEEIKTVDPKDGKLVQNIQNKIYRAESIQGWLEDAIVSGLQSFQELEER
jgi:hypothetical protein